jgi:hypothetical protein
VSGDPRRWRLEQPAHQSRLLVGAVFHQREAQQAMGVEGVHHQLFAGQEPQALLVRHVRDGGVRGIRLRAEALAQIVQHRPGLERRIRVELKGPERDLYREARDLYGAAKAMLADVAPGADDVGIDGNLHDTLGWPGRIYHGTTPNWRRNNPPVSKRPIATTAMRRARSLTR